MVSKIPHGTLIEKLRRLGLFLEAQRVEGGLCPFCRSPINHEGAFRDALSRREFELSGLCQLCQDEVFEPSARITGQETREKAGRVMDLRDDLDPDDEPEVRVNQAAIDDILMEIPTIGPRPGWEPSTETAWTVEEILNNDRVQIEDASEGGQVLGSGITEDEFMIFMDALPEPVRVIVTSGIGWLAGGSLRILFERLCDRREPITRWSMARDLKASDLDLFFAGPLYRDEAEVVLTANDYVVKYRCPEGKLATLESDGWKVQLVTNAYFTRAVDVIDHFDFTACQFILTNEALFLTLSALEDVKDRVLRLHALHYPAATMRRIGKYVKHGYRITAEFAQDYIMALREGVFMNGSDARLGDDLMRWYVD